MERYSSVYRNFDRERFYFILKTASGWNRDAGSAPFQRDEKQLAILLGLSAKTEYLLCDETFDGLDPVMRQSVKSIFAKEMQERQFTPVIASPNLRELEDICDHVGLFTSGRRALIEGSGGDEVQHPENPVRLFFQRGREAAVKAVRHCKMR